LFRSTIFANYIIPLSSLKDSTLLVLHFKFLHIHAGDGANEQLVAVKQRLLSVRDRATQGGHFVRETEEVREIQQQLEVRQLVRERPAFLAHPTIRKWCQLRTLILGTKTTNYDINSFGSITSVMSDKVCHVTDNKS